MIVTPFDRRLVTRSTQLVLAILLAVSALGSAATPAQAVGGETYVQLTNQKRASVGKGPVALVAQVDLISVERAQQMASHDDFSHDLNYVSQRLNQLGVCYTRVGEIIAWERGYSSYSYARTIEQWWKSDGHRAIMVGDYNSAGGSWAVSSKTGTTYAVMVFVKLCSPPPASSPAPAPEPTLPVTRLWGSDRYATAAAVSAASFAPGVHVAYVATGAAFPDALAGSAVAARHDAPLLLVTRDTIPSVTANELARLRPGRIVVLGGGGSVSDGVVHALRGYTGGGVTRLWGADRYATAAAISSASVAPGVGVAYVATGERFPDALAGASAAGRDRGPVLLVKGNTIPPITAAELGRLRPGRIVILGGSGAVSDEVARGLTAFTTGSVTRLAGSDRYATAVAVSRAGFSGTGSTVYVATGTAFPDGLSGGAVAGGLPGPLLLVAPNALPASVADELRRLDPGQVVVLGGTGSISDGVVHAIRTAVP